MRDGIVEGAAFFEMGLPNIHHAHQLFLSTLPQGCVRIEYECAISLQDELVGRSQAEVTM